MIYILLLVFIIYLLLQLNNTKYEYFSNSLNKTLFIYWAQGFNNAPDVVQKCLISWKKLNPTWKITELDDTNIKNFINLENEIPNMNKKNISKTALSDIIRIFLLEKYGGLWVDATTFCNISLDNWLHMYIDSGFFAFDNISLLSSWFIYSNKNNYMTKMLKKKVVEYWNKNNKATEYFWFHKLFGNLYDNDKKFRNLWDMTPKKSAYDAFLWLKLTKKICNDKNKIKKYLNNKKIPLYKLTYKFNKNKYKHNCIHHLLKK